MMDLIFEYLIVIILLFATNIGFLARNIEFNNNKFIILNLFFSLMVFILSFAFSSLSLQEETIQYIPYFLALVCIIMLIVTIIHVSLGKSNRLKLDLNNRLIPFLGTILSSFIAISALSLGLKAENLFLSSVELAILSFVVMLFVYKISKIFKRAKRDYYVVVGEYMFLEFILLLILALTFSSVRELDYSMFGSFLILTPTYKILYMLVIIAFILVLGVLYNDRVLKKLKRK